MLMGFLPIVGFIVELLDWSVPSQAVSYIFGPSLGVTLDGASNMWLFDVHSYYNACNGFPSSRLS